MGYGRTSGRTPLPRTSVYTRNAYSNGYRRSSSYNGFGLGLGEFDFHFDPSVPNGGCITKPKKVLKMSKLSLSDLVLTCALQPSFQLTFASFSKE